MTMMIFMASLSIIFIFISHPLSMGFILLIQTLNIAMWTGFMSMNFWYSYILFIIMVGGMLILFIYMTSIASNEKFKFNMKTTMTMLLTIMLMCTIMLLTKDQMTELMNSTNIDIIQLKSNLLFKMSLNKFLMMPLIFLSLTIISYLFIALIAVSKITNTKMGPLRKNM
uniref:NADH-ubiquinone oxidoreductase chain 6 n=1 Tax=Sclerotia substriata TaxID=1652676 RepID=A0A0U2C188_9COLE|nr:NADH dehydrogenase subunit 6 [Sclerotia substriata]AKG95432.1 NADH dehydrogenase subunit 6 [Sclerotia substriata]